MRNEMREADVNRKFLIRSIADLFQKMLPVNMPPFSLTPKSELSDFGCLTSKPVTPSLQNFDTQLPSISREIIYETPDPSPVGDSEVIEEDVGNAEDNSVETEVQDFGNKHFGKIAIPYVISCLYNRVFRKQISGFASMPTDSFE